ncbi:MAG: hypothetical protein AAGA86_12535 [Bacteroidota bacterium]
MENKEIDDLFQRLKGSLDLEEPQRDHRLRFLEKLHTLDKTVHLVPKKRWNWQRPLAIAASVVVFFSIGLYLFIDMTTKEDQVAEISPEVSRTQFYFANLIEQQVKELEKHHAPETEKIISDTLEQLNKLEVDYGHLEEDLLNGGNSKLILSAMITNFQTRIDLLKDVQDQIETIKTLKEYNNETNSI